MPHHEFTFLRQGHVATFEFVPFVGDPRECEGYVGAEVGIVDRKVAQRTGRAPGKRCPSIAHFG